MLFQPFNTIFIESLQIACLIISYELRNYLFLLLILCHFKRFLQPIYNMVYSVRVFSACLPYQLLHLAILLYKG